MELNKDFREFIEFLNLNKVKYLVVGGYAVNFHGYPRYTKDLDFWIWMESENIKRLLKALNDFGFGGLGLTEEDFSAPDVIIQLGYEPNRIDLIMDLEGLSFENSFQKKMEVILDETPVNLIAIEDLVTAKKEAGRLQDLADAEKLEKIIEKQRKT